jgi:hypothetical protein
MPDPDARSRCQIQTALFQCHTAGQVASLEQTAGQLVSPQQTASVWARELLGSRPSFGGARSEHALVRPTPTSSTTRVPSSGTRRLLCASYERAPDAEDLGPEPVDGDDVERGVALEDSHRQGHRLFGHERPAVDRHCLELTEGAPLILSVRRFKPTAAGQDLELTEGAPLILSVRGFTPTAAEQAPGAVEAV